jgi:hypothetical protein
MRKCFSVNILLLSLCLGCGTGDYEAKLDHRKVTSKFDVLLPAENLAGTRVSIRTPSEFKLPPLAEGTADVKRYKPGVVTVPGLKRTCEGLIEDAAKGQIPFYCHIGVIEASADQAKKTAEQLQAEVAKLPKGETVQWSPMQVATPNGRESNWQMLRLACPQEFYYKTKEGKDTFTTMDGILEVYLHEEGGYAVVIVWRLPSSVEQNVGLPDLAKLMAGAVSVK